MSVADNIVVIVIIVILAVVAYPEYKSRRECMEAKKTSVICKGGYLFDINSGRQVVGANGGGVECQ